MLSIVPGSVALHNDGGHHWAVVLKVEEDQCWALFLTSNPLWSEKCRRATKDELMLAGFRASRPTYLALAVRPVWDFEPLGHTFPDHRVEALQLEFSEPMRLRQVAR